LYKQANKVGTMFSAPALSPRFGAPKALHAPKALRACTWLRPSAAPRTCAHPLAFNGAARPRAPLSIRRNALPDVSQEMLEASSLIPYYAGKAIMLFAVFYFTLNWAYYRSLRSGSEEQDSTDKSKGKGKGKDKDKDKDKDTSL
jgi:hypothetical protein